MQIVFSCWCQRFGFGDARAYGLAIGIDLGAPFGVGRFVVGIDGEARGQMNAGAPRVPLGKIYGQSTRVIPVRSNMPLQSLRTSQMAA